MKYLITINNVKDFLNFPQHEVTKPQHKRDDLSKE